MAPGKESIRTMSRFRVDTAGVSLLAMATVFHIAFFAVLLILESGSIRFHFEALMGLVFMSVWLLLPYVLTMFCWFREDRMRFPWLRYTAIALIVLLALVLWSGFIWDIYQHYQYVDGNGLPGIDRDAQVGADSNNMTLILLPFLQLLVIAMAFACLCGIGVTSGVLPRSAFLYRRIDPKW